MSRRLLVVLITLGVLVAGGGMAGGLLLGREPRPPGTAAPTTRPAATTPDTTGPATSSSATTAPSSSTSTSTTAGLTVRARVVQRLEDGLVVRYDASEPVTAELVWGFSAPRGNLVPIPGPAAQGTVKLTLTRSTRPVQLRVTGRAADGRAGSSGTLTARRLVRRVVLEVRSLSLDFPSGTAGISTGFFGVTYTPLGPGLTGPTASAEPYAFPSVGLEVGDSGAPLVLRFYHQVPPDAQRTRVVEVAVPFPGPGRSATVNRDVTAIGVTAHLGLRVTVGLS